MASSPETFSSTSSLQRFYRTVWRWHFYAGLFVIPFMLVLACTGLIYLYKPQLDQAMYANLLFVQPTGSGLAYSQQVEVAQTAFPEAKISKITPGIAANRSTEIELTTAGENLSVFVDPYSGKLLGQQDRDTNFQQRVRDLHGKLMIGKVGSYIVELAACWGLVLLATGLYLWWHREGLGIWGTVLPRFNSSSRRIFWRDLHVVPGFYGMILVGFLILTGLPWSEFWGNSFAQVWNQFPAQLWNEIPQSTVLTKALNQGSPTVPWAAELMPMPQSGHASHAQAMGSMAMDKPQMGIPNGTPVNLDSVIALAQAKGAVPGFNVSLPEGEKGVYTVSGYPNDVTKELTLHIDQYSGKILAEIGWQDYAFVPKAVEMGVAIHMGKAGLGNQLLMTAACLVVILLCVSGSVMWWQRRPSGRLGAPAMPIPQWKVPVGLIAVMGVAFPLVGASLVFMLILEYLVLRRIPALQKILN